jgi:hypothetical protein
MVFVGIISFVVGFGGDWSGPIADCGLRIWWTGWTFVDGVDGSMGRPNTATLHWLPAGNAILNHKEFTFFYLD